MKDSVIKSREDREAAIREVKVSYNRLGRYNGAKQGVEGAPLRCEAKLGALYRLLGKDGKETT